MTAAAAKTSIVPIPFPPIYSSADSLQYTLPMMHTAPPGRLRMHQCTSANPLFIVPLIPCRACRADTESQPAAGMLLLYQFRRQIGRAHV